MVRLIMFIVLGYVLYMIVKGFMKDRKPEVEEKSTAAGEETYRDPVCGVYVSEDDAVIGRLEGKRLHFCSMACLEKYQDSLTHERNEIEGGGKA